MHAAPKVAFTPKGGCPLKPKERPTSPSKARPCSIHPQGWVPIETLVCGWPSPAPSGDGSSIHPQGWVPIETEGAQVGVAERVAAVAFTPKGGCPLKPVWFACTNWRRPKCSIHPQGWVLTGVQGFSAGFQPQARFSQQGGRANRRSPLHPAATGGRGKIGRRANRRSPLHPATTGGRGRTSSATTRAPWSLGQDSSRTAPATPSLCSRPCAARPESARSRSRHSRARAGWSR